MNKKNNDCVWFIAGDFSFKIETNVFIRKKKSDKILGIKIVILYFKAKKEKEKLERKNGIVGFYGWRNNEKTILSDSKKKMFLDIGYLKL